MTNRIFMVLTGRDGVQIPGESDATVSDQYLKKVIANPIEITDFDVESEQNIDIGSGGGGGGSGKVVLNPFTVRKYVDRTSQLLFGNEAAGIPLNFVDILVVKDPSDGGSAALKPYLSYRLGTVYITKISTSSDEESVREDVSFVYGQFQFAYQIQRPDGTFSPFAPSGWDRIKNVRI